MFTVLGDESDSNGIPTLDTPVEQFLAESQHPAWRASRHIVATAAIGLSALVCAILFFDGHGVDAKPVSLAHDARDWEARTPSLILVEESTRLPRAKLVESITALLGTRDLADEVTVEFALQSLKTVLVADPGNEFARRRAEDLSRQLAAEARSQRDKGNTALAIRMIQHASSSGVAVEEVNLAAKYITAQQPSSHQ
ncbi:MAG: hypothetical protein OES38_01920 [Gammaproteobacteria bacterium]|nr:hypothetical protein [Gammaproteobacteria bacterium]